MARGFEKVRYRCRAAFRQDHPDDLALRFPLLRGNSLSVSIRCDPVIGMAQKLCIDRWWGFHATALDRLGQRAELLPHRCNARNRASRNVPVYVSVFRNGRDREIIARVRRSLYKYFTDRKWADAFLDGEVFFRSLAYFRDYEDENVREDKNEGNSVYRPAGGLLITNHTQGKTFTMPGWTFESTVNQEEIFVFCASRSLTDELRIRFKAVACVEVFRIRTLYERIRTALPPHAALRAGRVDYYDPIDAPNPRWALSDLIAVSKFKNYQWQDEFRFVFCLTDALGFEKAALRLVKGEAREIAKPAEHRSHLLKVRNLHDICRLHES